MCDINQLTEYLANFNKNELLIGFTGHVNIEKALNETPISQDLTQYDTNLLNKLYKKLDTFFYRLPIFNYKLTFITGMARGWDEIIALYAMQKNYKLILAIPNSVKWHKNRNTPTRIQAIYYDKILNYPNIEIVEIKKNYNNQYFKYYNFARNQFIADKSDLIIVFKGYYSSGTNDCIKRIKKNKKCMFNFFDFLKRPYFQKGFNF